MWLTSNFSLKYHPWVKYYGDENNKNDQPLEKLLTI